MSGRARVFLAAMTETLGSSLADYLERRGYIVDRVAEDWELSSRLASGEADVALIGPTLDSPSVFQLLRERNAGVGPQLILLRPTHDLVERVVALELGAQDVIDASVEPREIAARVAQLVVRAGASATHLIRLDDATIDLKAALVMHRTGSEEQLSPGQVALARLFFANPRKVLTREDIIQAAPAENADAFDRSIDSRIVRLRRKLQTDRIATIRGTGYRFDPPPDWG